MKKREEIIRRRLEADRKERIEKVLKSKILVMHNELGVKVEDLRKEFDLMP
jgi:hypothetical protein